MSKPILPLPGHFAPPQSQPHQGPQGAPGGPPPPQPPGPTKPTYSKRGKITIVACVPCRKRKTKCDGKRPACTQCISRDGVCRYDMSEEQRRLTYLRENVEHLAEEKSALENLLWNLSSSSEQEASEILRRLRTGTDPQTLAQHIQAGRSLAQVRRDSIPSASGSAYPPLVTHSRHNLRLEHMETLIESIARADLGEVDEVLRRLRMQEDVNSIMAAARAGSLVQPLIGQDNRARPGLEGDFSAQDQTFGLTRTGSRSGPHADFDQHRVPNAHTPLNRGNRWTSVTNDSDFIDHLVTIYFTWQHSFFQSFPEHLFRQDMNSGRTKYCSRFLVNAICAAGCLLSNHPKAQVDPKNPQASGHMLFYQEATRLMSNEHQSSIPTVAGLFLLCHVDGYRGRLNSTWEYCGRSGRMALDLNLHLRSDFSQADNIRPDIRVEDRAKLHTFWGCFMSDQVISFTLGRLPQIPTNAITIDLPSIDHDEDQQAWSAYGADSNEVDTSPKPSYQSTTFFEVASLSKIVNSTLMMFFAPSETMKGSLLLTEYEKYESWYLRLPSELKSLDNAPPHILCLHMYYHAAVLLLFRPFLKAKFTESTISPSEICRSSANKISDIFSAHRKLYNTVGIYTFQIHCLLTACTIHLINVPTISSTSYLTAACNHFHDLLPRNEWAAGSLNILKGLVQLWNIVLPQEADVALFKNDSEISMPSFLEDNTDPALTGNSMAYAEIFRPHKRVAIMNPSPEGIQKRAKLSDASSTSVPTANMGQQSRAAALNRNNTSSGSSAATPTNPSGSAAPPTAPPASSNFLLFAPFPNQPAPLLGPIHTSTRAETAFNDEMQKVAQGFDGLTFETGEGSAWLYDPFMGFGWWQEAE